jgi:hypothetical protein
MLKRLCFFSTVYLMLLLFSACDMPDRNGNDQKIAAINPDKATTYPNENVTLSVAAGDLESGDISFEWECSIGNFNTNDTRTVIWHAPEESPEYFLEAVITCTISSSGKTKVLTQKITVLAESVKDHNHTMVPNHDSTGHWTECSDPECDFRYEVEEHQGLDKDEDGHWVHCRVCGYVAPNKSVHEWGDEKIISNFHLHECTVCGYPEETPHTMDWERTNTDHRKKCTKCSHATAWDAHSFMNNSDNNYHWESCSVCGYAKSKSAHNMIKKNDSTHHWNECAYCGFTSTKSAHSMVPTYNSSAHWLECSSCGYKGILNGHSFSTKYDSSKHWQECNCGYKTSQNSHSLSTHYNSSNHWKECSSCSYKSSNSGHSMGSWVLVQVTNTLRIYRRECSGCGYNEIKEEPIY